MIDTPFYIKFKDNHVRRRVTDENDFNSCAMLLAYYVSEGLYELDRFDCNQTSYRITPAINDDRVINILDDGLIRAWGVNYSDFRDSCEYFADICTFSYGDFKFTVPKKFRVECTDDSDVEMIRTLKHDQDYFYKFIFPASWT